MPSLQAAFDPEKKKIFTPTPRAGPPFCAYSL